MALLAVAALLLVTVVPMTAAEHERRNVQPTGLREVHYPVVAGFELIPDPPLCGAGTPQGATQLTEDFDDGGWQTNAPATGHGSGNLWHRTTEEVDGTSDGHSQDGHMYFGIDAQGNYDDGRAAGDIHSPDLTLAEDRPAYLSMATKWEVEYFEGYDHMWVEVRDLSDGNQYLLCTLNPPARSDGSSNDQTTPACSPEDLGPCSDLDDSHASNFAPDRDPAAPHWEHRYVRIPEFLQGEQVRIELSFDSADHVSNIHIGWMVDDLTVSDDVDVQRPILPAEG